MAFKTADLYDEHVDKVQVCTLDFRSYGGKKRFSGKIETVDVFEDNVLVKETLETAAEGSVVVINGGGSRNCALLGDRLAGIALSRGIEGIIIHGCVRDSVELAKMDIGVLAIGTTPRRSKKNRLGEKGVKLFFGDVKWLPGDYVYADEDGVIISKEPLI